MHAAVVGAHRGRHQAPLSQGGQIEKVERSDAGRDPIRGHARQATAGKGQVQQVEAADDVEHKPRIRSRIERKSGQIVMVALHDLTGPIAHVAIQRFAFAEHLARDGVQRVLLHPHESPAKQIHAVKHEPARDGRVAAAEVALRRTDPEAARLPSELKGMAHPGG